MLLQMPPAALELAISLWAWQWQRHLKQPTDTPLGAEPWQVSWIEYMMPLKIHDHYALDSSNDLL
jgi:hypothetical protein